GGEAAHDGREAAAAGSAADDREGLRPGTARDGTGVPIVRGSARPRPRQGRAAGARRGDRHHRQPASVRDHRPARQGPHAAAHRRRAGEDPVMLLALLLAAAPPAEGFKARGFILPDGAVKIDDDRYRLPQPWDEAVKYYRRAYPSSKYPRHVLKSQ